MAETQNSELIKELQSATKIQTMNGVPRSISNQIVPVVEINPKLVKNAQTAFVTLVNTTSGNILAANANQDIYITAAGISMIKDAGSTGTGTYISYYENGAIKRICFIPSFSGTASSGTMSISFPHPIKIDRNTAIIANASNNANFTSSCFVSYFIDDSSNG